MNVHHKGGQVSGRHILKHGTGSVINQMLATTQLWFSTEQECAS
jgi:hypothetical protein